MSETIDYNMLLEKIKLLEKEMKDLKDSSENTESIILNMAETLETHTEKINELENKFNLYETELNSLKNEIKASSLTKEHTEELLAKVDTIYERCSFMENSTIFKKELDIISTLTTESLNKKKVAIEVNKEDKEIKYTITDYFIEKLLNNKMVTKKKSFREYYMVLNDADKTITTDKLILDKVRNIYSPDVSVFEQNDEYYRIIGKPIYNLIKSSKSRALNTLINSFEKYKNEKQNQNEENLDNQIA